MKKEKPSNEVPTSVRSNKDLINPLQRMLGAFIRLERRRLNISSKIVAGELGLAETYYRLLESGRVPLNQGLTFKLIEILGKYSSNSYDQGVQIHFHRLAVFLVGAQCVGAEMVRLVSEGKLNNYDKIAFQTLAEKDADFEKLLEEMEDYFSTNDDDAQRQFLENRGAPCVGNFLATNAYVEKNRGQIVEQVIPADVLLHMPTLNIEMVSSLILHLKGRPFVHTAKLAAEWEQRVSRQIVEVHGFFSDYQQIMSEDNLSMFNYSYLTEKSFSSLRFIFERLEQGKTAEQLKNEFINSINGYREKDKLEKLTSDQINKVHFVLLQGMLSSEDLCILCSSESGTRPKSEDRKAYWSFSTQTGTGRVPIGFVGGSNHAAADIWNLSLLESETKQNRFAMLWKEIMEQKK